MAIKKKPGLIKFDLAYYKKELKKAHTSIHDMKFEIIDIQKSFDDLYKNYEKCNKESTRLYKITQANLQEIFELNQALLSSGVMFTVLAKGLRLNPEGV